MKYRGILVGAFLSSALLAACGGNHSFSSPTSFMPPGTAPSSSKTSGIEKVLHSFQGGTDGAAPAYALTYVGETLDGTTQFGGTNSTCPNGNQATGCGTVFKMTLGGMLTTLYSFCPQLY